jgi:phosphoribosylformimino-5-aminoimidazole carboxamide ribotide isomerase
MPKKVEGYTQKFRVIPVIDILNGVVVHAIKGQRKEYKPLQSVLINSFNPVEVALEFEKLGFNQLYIADLDAIITCSMDFSTIKQIADQTDLELMVDAGITSTKRAQHLLDNGVSKLIIGTETLERQDFVEEAVHHFGKDHLIVSLDLKGEETILKTKFDCYTDPISLLEQFKRIGVAEVIILDLARVGSGEGVNMGFLEKIKQRIRLRIYVGGGVRNINDLVKLKSISVSGALVATALHNGKININELTKEGFL